MSANRRDVRLQFNLRSRNAETAEIEYAPKVITAKEIGVVVIDMWNGYGCPTGAELFGNSLIPRMNRALNGARVLGMQVIHAPSDAADFYAGWPQAEATAILPRYKLEQTVKVPDPVFVRQDGTPLPQNNCLCGPGIVCHYQHAWDGIHPDLSIKEEDLILLGPVYGEDGTQRLHAVCSDRGLTHLIYTGCATNCCVVGKAAGAVYIARAGIQPILARDLTEAVTEYNPLTGYTNDDGTRDSIACIEGQSFPSIDLAEELGKAGLWDKSWIVESVHIAPWWSRKSEPYQFEEACTITMGTPKIDGDEIRYTLDGLEPTSNSSLYTGPFEIRDSCALRAVSFKSGKLSTRESRSYFRRVIEVPPEPDVHLSDISPVRATAPLYLDGHTSFGVAPNIKWDLSYAGSPLQMRDIQYKKGVGVMTPSQLLYRLEPTYERFVAIAGVDDAIVAHDHGMHRANHPKILFRILIDGLIVSESPVIRSCQTWRFNIEIPVGSCFISFAAMNGGDGNQDNLADWAAAGFLIARR